MKAKRYALHGLGITAAAFVAILVSPFFFRGVGELGWENLLFRLRGARPADPRLVFAAIDDESIKKLGAFPWPRDLHARLIDKLSGLGVKKIVYDVMFFEPSAWPKKDAALARATRRAKDKVVHAVTYQGVCANPEVQSGGPHGWIFSYPPGTDCKLTLPFDALLKAGAALGSNNADPESDGTIRTSYVFSEGVIQTRPDIPFRGNPPAMAAAALDLNDEGLANVGFKDPLRLNYRAPFASRPYRMVSVSRILSGELRPEEAAALSGAIVVVGSASRNAFDEFRSPFGEPMPGSFVHLTLLDNLLHRDPLSTSILAYLAPSAWAALFLALVMVDTPAFLGGAAALSLAAFLAALLAFGRGILIVWPGLALPLLIGCAWTIVLRAGSRRLHG